MPANPTDEGLLRVIGIPGLTQSIINAIIGAGIFALPGLVSMSMGAYGIFAYILCSMLLAAIMLCYVEIGSRVTTSGGSYAYVEAAFGPLPGYIVNWLYLVGWGIMGSAALMVIIANSLAVVFPVFLHPLARTALFAAITVFMVTINIVGARQGVVLIKALTVIKIIPLLGIILFGFSQVKLTNLHLGQLPSYKDVTGTTLILFFAIAGFENSLGASGEVKDPNRTIPASMGIAGAIVLVLYILLQTITQGALGPQMALHKDAPLAAVADRIIGPVGATIVLFCAAFSSLGNIAVDILSTPRSLFAGANDGLFPKPLGRVHARFGTPYIAIIVYSAAIFIVSLAGGFQQLAIMASATLLLVYLAVVLATVKLRKKDGQDGEKHFRTPGGWAIPIIAVAGIIWLLCNLGKWEILSTVIFIAAVCILYFIQTRLLNKKRSPAYKR